jgi:DNA-binding NtrC family response regulator
VLVVEDEESLRVVIKRMLRQQGYTAILAANAEDALERFERDPSIDVVLSDVVMRGASGPQLVEQLRKQRPTLKVLYMSGYTDEAIIHHGVLTPGIAFLHKPFTSDALGRKIRHVLDNG